MTVYYSLDPAAKIDAVKEACAAAKAGGYEYICVPQWFVSTAAEALADSPVGVSTILSLPGGTTSSKSKYAEAKWAIVNGADLLIFPVNMTLCAAGEFDKAKGDLDSALVACKTANGCRRGVKPAALIDGGELDADGIKKAVSFCASAGVAPIFIAHNEGAVNALKGEFDAVQAF